MDEKRANRKCEISAEVPQIVECAWPCNQDESFRRIGIGENIPLGPLRLIGVSDRHPFIQIKARQRNMGKANAFSASLRMAQGDFDGNPNPGTTNGGKNHPLKAFLDWEIIGSVHFQMDWFLGATRGLRGSCLR